MEKNEEEIENLSLEDNSKSDVKPNNIKIEDVKFDDPIINLSATSVNENSNSNNINQLNVSNPSNRRDFSNKSNKLSDFNKEIKNSENENHIENSGVNSNNKKTNSQIDNNQINGGNSNLENGSRNKFGESKSPFGKKKNPMLDTRKAGPNRKKTGGDSPARRERLKDKWNNRPKNPKEFANKAKNGIKDGIKNGAKNALDNSKVGQAINKGKNAVNNAKKTIKKTKQAAQKTKTVVKTIGAFLKTPAGLITLGVIVGILLILVIVIMVPSMFASGSPQVGGEVQNEENYNKYSEVDQKTIEKLKTASQKYSSGNPSYAMAATLYPYMDEMQNGNVSSIRGKTNTSQSDDEDVYDEEDNSDESDNEDLEESKNDTISNDPYLELFRKRKYRKKFEKLLKISKDGDDALTEYLKNTWFKKDAGYKELFDGVKDETALSDAIISDIQDQKDDFKGYFYDNCSTTYSAQEAGSVEVDEMLKGNILVDVKVSSCTTGKNVWDCESMYDTPIDMAKYSKGVTYEEIGVSGSSDVEKVKAQIVAAKSYVIGRSKSMGWGVRQDSAGNYIVTIRANTNDQDYCDIDVGCKSGKTEVRSGSSHRDAVDEDTRSKLDEAWEATKNVYIQSSNGALKGEFCNSRTGVCDFCHKGTCLAHQELSEYSSTTYDNILMDQYSSYSLVTVEGEFASAVVGTANTTCSTTSDGSNFIYYSQNDYKDTAFCHRALEEDSSRRDCNYQKNSICTSGCGVTSAAMVIATLTQNTSITPETLNSTTRKGTDCDDNNGTNSTFFPYASSNNGLEAKGISTKEDIISTLDSGGLVIANVDGSFGDGVYKTGGGHYVVIRGYSGNDVYIADPWQNSNVVKHCEEFDSSNHCTKLSTDFDTFINNVKTHAGAGFYAFTGGTPFSENGTTDNEVSGEKGKATGTLGYPVKGVKGCSGTDFPNYEKGGYHGGSDINRSANGGKDVEGKTVVAADGGTISIKKELTTSYGNYVEIDHGNGYYTLYGHMKAGSIVVEKGQKVAKGEKIGIVGSTGKSTGPHLHIELRTKSGSNKGTLNPCNYIGKNKSYVK